MVEERRVIKWTFKQFASNCKHQSYDWGHNKCHINKYRRCLKNTCPVWVRYKLVEEV